MSYYRIVEVAKTRVDGHAQDVRSIVVAGCNSLTQARDLVVNAILHRHIDMNVAQILVEDGDGNVVSSLDRRGNGDTWVEKADGASLFSGKRIGAVIVFKADVSRVRAKEMLEKLERQGLIESQTVLHEFNPAEGYPVWYIP